jgi:hypothetical protein
VRSEAPILLQARRCIAAPTLGIRPEQVGVRSGPIAGRATHVERLAESTLVHVAFGAGRAFMARTARDDIVVGDAVQLELPARAMRAPRRTVPSSNGRAPRQPGGPGERTRLPLAAQRRFRRSGAGRAPVCGDVTWAVEAAVANRPPLRRPMDEPAVRSYSVVRTSRRTRMPTERPAGHRPGGQTLFVSQQRAGSKPSEHGW